jgi:hypothetical protein
VCGEADVCGICGACSALARGAGRAGQFGIWCVLCAWCNVNPPFIASLTIKRDIITWTHKRSPLYEMCVADWLECGMRHGSYREQALD